MTPHLLTAALPEPEPLREIRPSSPDDMAVLAPGLRALADRAERGKVPRWLGVHIMSLLWLVAKVTR